MTPQEAQSKQDRLEKLRKLRALKAQRAEVVDEGGMASMPTVREVVDAMPSFLTRTAEEKRAINTQREQAETNRNNYYQEKLREIPRGIMGPAWGDRAKERDIILERDGKTMTGPEAGLTRAVNSLTLTVPQYLSKDWNEQVGAAGNEYPGISMSADVGGFLLPGTGAFNALAKGASTVGRVIAPGGRTLTGSGVLSRLGRWSPVLAKDTAASVGDYALYEATVGTGTRAAQDGRQPTLQEAGQAALNAPTDPWAYLGGLASPLNRAVRGGASVATGGRVSMTPQQRAQWANGVMQLSDPRSKAFQMIAKRLDSDGITPEMLTQAVENYYYAGYSTVDEMLFEIAEAASSGKGGGQIKQLAVALGSVGGDAQQAARSNLRERRLTSLERMRDDLRKAAGLDGSDFYKYSDQLKEAERTLPDYATPYAASIDDASWIEKVWPDFQTKPASQQAIIEAYGYARNRGELEVASEISDLLPALGYRIDQTGDVVKLGSGEAGRVALERARGNVPAKPSTQALDYIDRMLGDEAEKLRNPTAGGRRELAQGPADAQTSLRSVVDEETGLDQPRRVVHELKTAQQALDFGRKSSAAGTDLETLQREFLREMRKYADDGAQVLGEETATINAALLMGWMRGAEDMISKASNPATAIRQLYGNERQREKLVQMLMGLDDTRLAQQFGTKPENIAKVSTGNSAETMRLRQVAGGKYGEKGTPRSRGRFDRERIMLDSENQIVGNSQTGQRNAAVEAQGGLQNRVNAFVNAAFDPRQAARKLTLNTVGRAFQPGIFNSAINRELGDIMFTGGRGQLNDIIGELQTHMGRRNALAPPSSGGSGGSMGGVAAAQASAGASSLPQKRAASNGLPMLNNPTVGGAVAGGMAGGSMAQDLDGDGRVSMQERYVQGSLGALTGGLGGRAIGKLDNRMISQGSRQVLEGGNPPSEAGFSKPGRTSDTIYAKSGRKYSMAEGSTMSKVIELARQGKSNTQIDEALGLSPGVAAHYRNVAKTGKPPIDMSPQGRAASNGAGGKGQLPMDEASRMARAREMGFDTENVSYRGINGDYDLSKAGNYQMFTRSPEDAGEFGNNVIPAYLRKGRNLQVNGGGNNFNSVPVARLPDDVRANLHPSTGNIARTDEIAYAAQKAGYDSVSINNVYDNAYGEIPRKPAPRTAYDDQEIDRILAELGGSSADDFGPVAIAPEIPRNYDPTTVDIVFDPKNIRSKYAQFDPAQSDSPVLTAGIGGRRRKDILKDVMPGSQGSRVPGVSSPSRRADGPSAQSIPPAPVGDGGDGLGLLMGGAAALGGGVAVTNALAGGNPQAQGSGGANAFASRIANSAQSGMNRMQQGLPFPPSVKPDLSRNMDQMNQAAYLQSKDEMQALYENLPQGERLAWNQLREEMAEELKVKPEEARAGIIDKRLLPNGELQVLIEGQWKTLEFVQ
jgi:hypothetical protein